jgi:hypothetical protein
LREKDNALATDDHSENGDWEKQDATYHAMNEKSYTYHTKANLDVAARANSQYASSALDSQLHMTAI